MEADWDVEIGPGAPVIDALWGGFVDLTKAPALARELPEIQLLPQLEHALIRLNAPESPVWTAKCDVWSLSGEGDFDPYELDAAEEDALVGWGCYIDLLPRSHHPWGEAARAVESGRFFCSQLRDIALRSCRADLVVRSAMMDPDTMDVGITAYLTAFGSTIEAAKQVLGEAVTGLADAVLGRSAIE